MLKKIDWKYIARADWYLWVLLALAFAFTLYVYPSLPDQVPFHFNMQGEVDDYTSKGFGIFFPLVLTLGIYLMMIVLAKLDPRGENYEKMRGTWSLIRGILGVIFLLVWGLTLYVSMGYKIQVNLFFSVVFSIFFIVLGNVMGRVKPTYFIGVRTPWTIESETVWKKTHRLFGALMVGGGVISLLLTIFGLGFWGIMATAIVSSVVPMIYSYVIYKKEKFGEN